MTKIRNRHTTSTPIAKRGASLNEERPLTEIEERFLCSIYNFYYLTVPQIAALHYERITRSILNYVAAILKNLDDEHENYLLRGSLSRALRTGRNPSVFRLSARGIDHMASMGFSPLPSGTSLVFPDFGHLAHSLEVNEFIIAAKRLTRHFPSCELVEVRHNWMLQAAPIYIPGEKKEDPGISLIPDAWLDFRLSASQRKTGTRLPVHLENDRGKDTVFSFKAKLLTLLRYINGPYEQYFHTPLVKLVFTTTEGEGRLRKLIEWTEELLVEHDWREAAPLLFFASLSQPPFEPRALFMDPIWHTPFDSRVKILLEDQS